MGFFDIFKKGPASSGPLTVGAVAKGKAIPMAEIPDPAFSQGFVGFCCGIEPEDGKVYSPVDGVVSQVPDTLHAVGLSAGGMELLIHVGVDTVDMNGGGFKGAVKPGQTVRKGELLLTMDLAKIAAAGHPAVVILAVTNTDDFAAVEPLASGEVQPGTGVLRVSK